MARLPALKLAQVKGEIVEDGEDRWDFATASVRKAIDRRHIAEKKERRDTKDE
ncbi:hypothetical protein [Marinisporobacter balticus]|uniref:Uncharacterized protein n=1 Tax=Marinisporobacter balticus TaxID=2018667 RepID=A0A4V2SCF6_9FIRM|nr:hypothetical protein [Marinisporobacter balticus]TCO79100.1 hypothetical protein EV214_103152 [Marinisporobacter balticus]